MRPATARDATPLPRPAARAVAALGVALLVASVLFQVGCAAPVPGPSAGPSGPTGPTDATGPAAPPAPTPPPAPAGPLQLPGLSVEARLPGGGAAAPLDVAGAAVDPGATFEVRVSAPVRSARLVLLDAQDTMVPAGSDVEPGPVSRFTLVPLEPLRPGSRYHLRLEGVESRVVRGDDGRSYEPAAIPLTTTGEPAAKPPPRRVGKKRTR